MTEPYPWHFHPNSDETLLFIEGRLCIELESGSVEFDPGQLVTIHREFAIALAQLARAIREPDL